MTAFKKIFLFLAVMGIIIVPAFVLADEFGLGDAAGGTQLIGSGTIVDSSRSLPELIGTIVGIVLSFVGAIFFLLILYAGLLWMIAFGNTERVDSAKSIVEHAAVGLIIVLAAYAISTFVFNKLAPDSGPASQNTTQTKTPGQPCGTKSVWNNEGACVSECQYTRAGICQDSTSATCARGYETGLCPGAANIQCCSLLPY